MNEEMIYVLPIKEKKKLDKTRFTLFCLLASLVCTLIVSLTIVLGLGALICGFVPVVLVATCCAVGQLGGTLFYIKKHKYAYGDRFEWYQVFNSVIYGVQNVLRVLLIVLLINICAVPIFVLLITIYVLFLVRRMFWR